MEEKQKSVLTPVSPQPVRPDAPVFDKPLVKPITTKKFNKNTLLMVLASVLVVVLGVTTGWFLAGNKQAGSSPTGSSDSSSSGGSATEAGIGDESSYSSTAEGVLKQGGIKGEGTHYIDRGLGEGKYVYLTSSVVDLDSFVDKKVQVWGETISAKYASWLIDVGRIKVVD
ncbi:MAG: hypothetical protein UT39_C0016G0009 [Candidatus Woesebacteria bacterium GW2011_GWA1_39_21]|uniref:Uncharacterized protein n=1 Tax=Candidatus Woesebacteria bacterium GW2011_GWA1_39_21 TaxID=1618550 RepID=A0A0G0N3A3_9BACT|nr:MAG: hypothetical protein UT39_C0016G0009 [Candidatus Woesebacteria bacterium GW2011_GWA1_39_21]